MPISPQKSVHSHEASGRSMPMLMSISAGPTVDSDDLVNNSDVPRDEACAHPTIVRQL